MLPQVPVDSLNKLMANKEELVKVLERHIVPGVRMEGKEVPDGATKLRSASGDEINTDRDNFVKVTIVRIVSVSPALTPCCRSPLPPDQLSLSNSTLLARTVCTTQWTRCCEALTIYIYLYIYCD